MLLKILQSAWQQIGPQAIQFVNSPAFPELVRNLQRNASQLIRIRYVTTESIFDAYNSLSPQEKNRLQNAVAWAAKDLSSDILYEITGLLSARLLSIKGLLFLGITKTLRSKKITIFKMKRNNSYKIESNSFSRALSDERLPTPHLSNHLIPTAR